MAFWLKERYFCTLFDAVKLFLPPGMNYRLYRQISFSPGFTNFDREAFTDAQWQLIACLRACRKPPELREFLSRCGVTEDCPALLELEKQGVITLSNEVSRQVNDATVRMARAVEELPEGVKLSPRQKEVYQVLREVGPASVKEVCYFTGVTPAVVTALVKKGGAQLFEQEVYRGSGQYVQAEPEREICLTDEQQRAYESLLAQYPKGGRGRVPSLWRYGQRKNPGVYAPD